MGPRRPVPRSRPSERPSVPTQAPRRAAGRGQASGGRRHDSRADSPGRRRLGGSGPRGRSRPDVLPDRPDFRRRDLDRVPGERPQPDAWLLGAGGLSLRTGRGPALETE